MTSSLTPAEARHAARNVGAIAIAQILSKGILFGWQLLLIPLLGPAEYGVYGTVSAAIQVGAVVAGFGIGNIVIREVARRRDQAGSYLSSALWLQTLLALLAYVGVNVFAVLAGYPIDVRAYLALGGLSLFIDMAGTLCYEQLQAQERMVINASIEVGHILVRVLLAGLALALGWGLLGVYVATLLTGIGRALVLWRVLWAGGVRPTFPLASGLRGRLLADATPLALGAFMGIGYLHADKLMSASLLGSEAVGFLTASYTITGGMIEVLSTTVLIAVYPLMARLSQDGAGTPYFRNMVHRLAFFQLLVTLPLTIGISIYADVLALLFGADFLPTASVLRLMIWSALVAMLVSLYAQALLMKNQQRLTLIFRAGGLAVNLALLWLLLPRLGIAGAPIASVSGALLILALLLWRFGREDMPPLRQYARVLLAGGLAAGTMLVIGQAQWLVGGLAGLAVYAAAVLGLGALSAADWALLWRMAGRG
jgi:O-antigen/teichoic acid export membrane protein